MASVSLSITLGTETVVNPDSIVVGSDAPATGDIEISVNMAKFTSMEQIYLALEQFDYFVKDAAKGPTNLKVL